MAAVDGSVPIERSAEDTAKQFQEYLRKYEKDGRLVILKAVDKPGSKLGDNYTSVLIRTELVGTRGDGSPYAKTFMTKTLTQRPAAGILNLFDLFRIEAHVYRNILPVLGLSYGPDCLFADKKNIIMEDLAKKGYVNCDRRNFLDMNHTIVALKKLAQLHASALAVKIKNPPLFDEMVDSLEEIIYKKNPDPQFQMRKCTELCMESTVNQLKMIEPRTPTLQNVIDQISNYVGNCYDIMNGLFNAPKQKYDTICHGDPWSNNLLFLHDKNGDILDLKMVDYQICRYTSVTTDILYLIYTSAHSSLIENSYETLIKNYHDEFIKQLRQRHVDEKTLAELGMDWLQAELKTYAFYGALTGCFLAHAMLADEADAKRFEEISFEDTTDFITNMTEMGASNQKKLDRIRCVATDYYKRYILGITNNEENCRLR